MRGGASGWNRAYRRNGPRGGPLLSYRVEDGSGSEETVRLAYLGRCHDLWWRHPGGSRHEVDVGDGALCRFPGHRESFSGDDAPWLVSDPETGRALVIAGAVGRLLERCDRHGWLGLCPALVYHESPGVVSGYEFGRGREPEFVWDAAIGGFRLRGGRYGVRERA